MDTITLKARGKINLTLDVIGKRDNGYHDLDMIMQTINLYDTIKIKKTKTPGIRIHNNLTWLPADHRNIAYKAAQLFLKEADIVSGIYIDIVKRIPVAAGLAGGSSDAAAVLVGMNKLFKTGYSKKQLMEMGVKIGADVPFCIMRGTVLAQGIGEVLTPIKPLPYTHLLLVKPNISVSTASVYKALQINTIKTHPQTESVVQAINKGDTDYIFSHMVNVLEGVTTKMHPEIEKIKAQMIEHGAISSMMSGSGPTVFGIFDSKKKAQLAADFFKVACELREVHVTSTFHRGKREGRKYGRRKSKHEN